jgi:hypothetical protein
LWGKSERLAGTVNAGRWLTPLGLTLGDGGQELSTELPLFRG